MDTPTKNIQDIPVTAFIAISLIIVFSLYLTSAIKTLPCDRDMISNFFGNFVHTDPYHIMANLYALYALSRVEQQLGTKKFFSLIAFLLFFNTLFETSLHYIKKDLPCSIGFSGILFGIMTLEIVLNKGIDFYIVTSISAIVLLPSIQNPNVSLTAHIIGSISGIIAALLYSKFIKTH